MIERIKQRMRAGEPVVAVNIGGANPDLVELLAGAGADIAFIDCERTGIGLDAATHALRAARAAGIAGVVRSASADPAVLVSYLDRKADGIVVPHVDDARQARQIVQVVRYACGAAAERKLVIPQIETRAAVANVAELAAVEGVDAFLIGPNDLGYDLTGNRGGESAELTAAIGTVVRELKAQGRAFGMPARFERIDAFRALGATLLYYPVEWLLERAMAELKGVLGRGPTG